jgi:hypothetical protein
MRNRRRAGKRRSHGTWYVTLDGVGVGKKPLLLEISHTSPAFHSNKKICENCFYIYVNNAAFKTSLPTENITSLLKYQLLDDI